MFEKIVVLPGVVIYKKMLKDVDKIMDIIKKTESYTEKTHIIDPWGAWAGNWKGGSTQVRAAREQKINGTDTDAMDQKFMMERIFETYYAAFNDFLENHAVNKREWLPFITDWDFTNKSKWIDAWELTFLRYDTNDSHEHKPETGRWDLAMNYHTDTNHDDLESPGNKKVFTVTMYLNDNYEGGEISFYDGESDKIYNYKPEAGDVTVFPGSEPFYHGVLPFYGGSRYLARMFWEYDFEGTDEWWAKAKKYGESTWREMERKRLEESWRLGKNIRRIVAPGQKAVDHFKAIYVSNEPIWLNSPAH